MNVHTYVHACMLRVRVAACVCICPSAYVNTNYDNCDRADRTGAVAATRTLT